MIRSSISSRPHLGVNLPPAFPFIQQRSHYFSPPQQQHTGYFHLTAFRAPARSGRCPWYCSPLPRVRCCILEPQNHLGWEKKHLRSSSLTTNLTLLCLPLSANLCLTFTQIDPIWWYYHPWKRKKMANTPWSHLGKSKGF